MTKSFSKGCNTYPLRIMAMLFMSCHQAKSLLLPLRMLWTVWISGLIVTHGATPLPPIFTTTKAGGEFILVVFGVGSCRAVIAWPILMIRVTYCECSSPNEGKVSKKLPCRWTSMVSRTESDWREGQPKKISSVLGVQVLFLICIMSPQKIKIKENPRENFVNREPCY